MIKMIRTSSMVMAILILLLSLSLFSACKKKVDPNTDDPVNPVTNPDDELDSSLVVPDYTNTAKIRATFKNSTAAIYKLPNKQGALNVSLGVQWTSEKYSFKFQYSQAEKIHITLGNYSANYPGSQTGSTLIEIPVESTEVNILNLEEEIPLKIQVSAGESLSEFAGNLLLSDYSLLFGSNKTDLASFTGKSYSSDNTIVKKANIGTAVENNALHIYDLYSTDSANNYSYLYTKLTTAENSAIADSKKTLLTEFDVNFASMPVYEWKWINSSSTYGFTVLLSKKDNNSSVMLTIQNTQYGLRLYVVGATNSATQFVDLGKTVGEQFRLGFTLSNSTLNIYVDGIFKGSFENAEVARKDSGNGTLSLIWKRNKDAAASSADSFDVSVSNFSVSELTEYDILKKLDVSDILGVDNPKTIPGEDSYLATQNLTLPKELINNKYGLKSQLTWKTDYPAVISDDGVVTAPENVGKLVKVTAYLLNGNTVVSERSITMFVKANHPNTSVLYVSHDVNPLTGVGVAEDTAMILDSDFGSVIYDAGSETNLNTAQIIGINSQNRVTKSFVALYYSNDNQHYTAITDFNMLNNDGNLYFYNFSVQARYLKVHFTYGDIPDPTVGLYQSLQSAMVAASTTEPLLAKAGEFTKTASITVKNERNEKVYDLVKTFTLSELSISAADLKSDCSDIRFRCNGKELPHYYSNGKFYVRILELPANGSVTLQILYQNSNAVSVSDGNETLEIQYGNRTVYSNSRIPTTNGSSTSVRWRTSVKQMPDGSLLTIGGTGSGGISWERSLDGGRTWTQSNAIPATNEFEDGGVLIVDQEQNHVFYFGYASKVNKGRKIIYIESNDSGYTWSNVKYLANQSSDCYALSYSNGLKLSSFDGAGPNVDYVFNIGLDPKDGGVGFSTSSVYSKDNGKTWYMSESLVNYKGGSSAFEGGMSEGTIWEQKDGTLVLYARTQLASATHFAMSFSYDHGVTWNENAVLSGVYAPNTQPIIKALNGVPVLFWGGNNSMGGTSYQRYPYSIAYSNDDGISFINIQDLSFQTDIEVRTGGWNGPHCSTNPDMVFYNIYGTNDLYLVSTSDRILVENITDYLYKTKGVFDSFEDGVEAEGWVVVKGFSGVGTKGATDGNFSMKLNAGTTVSRTVPSVVKGSLSFDLYCDSADKSMSIELQSAYNASTGKSAPISLRVDEKGNITYSYINAQNETLTRKTNLCLKDGQNHIVIHFDGTKGETSATLTVNGQTKNIAFNSYMGEQVSFLYINTDVNTVSELDSVILVDYD